MTNFFVLKLGTGIYIIKRLIKLYLNIFRIYFSSRNYKYSNQASLNHILSNIHINQIFGYIQQRSFVPKRSRFNGNCVQLISLQIGFGIE